MKKDFHAFMKKNKKKIYEIARKNAKHDKKGHCMFPSTDPWMSEPKLNVYSNL